jgi:hypothetical protein
MTNPEFLPPKKSRRNWPIIVLAVIVGLWFIGNLSSEDAPVNSSTESYSPPSSVEIPTYDDSWIPSDFSGLPDNDNVAWRWGTSSETNCTYSSGSCWSIMIVTRDGCPGGIYAELAILDKSEVQIDYTNDSTTSVPPNTKVKLTFDTFNEEADTARIGEISCR